MKIMPCLGLTACVFTAACGGSGGGGSDVLSFAELEQKNIDVIEILNNTPGAEDLPGTDLPDTGGAKYAGVMVFTASPTLRLAGITVVEAFFGAGRVQGTAEAFRDQNEAAYRGSLDIANSAIDAENAAQGAPSFTPDITGTLRSDANTVVIDGNLEGDFYGAVNDPTFVTGTISGTATVNGDVNTLTETGFIAERDEVF